ncbi:putative TadE-like protein [Vibrio owensii]|nr:putative TadE-like protein [Vibrio owensii]
MMKRTQTGVASIEFGIGFMAFFLMVMLWAELGYIAYVSSVNDLAIAEAARSAKTQVDEKQTNESESVFMAEFIKVVNEQASAMGGIIDPKKYKFSVRYFSSIADIGGHQGALCEDENNPIEAECGNSLNSALAIYAVDYQYQPMLAFFMDGSRSFEREVIVIQEYERDQFKF